MRITPSDNWNAMTAKSNRVITWTVSIKKTTALNEALSAGTWVDVTSFLLDIPTISQRIEYELGQFSSDSISFTGRNIDWWEANIFNATESQYLELKITATMSAGSTVTSDTFYAFCGFVDKAGVVYDEIQDSVSFDVFTADELGNRISILNVNTQYLNADVDGSGTDGLILPRLSGIFVTDCSVSSYNLNVGLHSIEYVYAMSQIRLDDGDYTTLSGSNQSVTLANALGDQKITLYIQAGSISASTETLTDYVIVETAGEAGITGTKQPYYGLSIGQFLKKLHAEVGIDSTTLDTLSFSSFDGTTKRISYYDIPPEDVSVTGNRYGICFDGTDIWVGVGNKLYKRTTSTETYTLMQTLTSGYIIGKMLYNSRNNEIFICSGDGSFPSDEFNRVNHYDITGDVLSNTISMATGASFAAVHIIDYNYTGSSYKYGLILLDTTVVILLTESGGSLSSTTVYTGTGSFVADTNGVGFIKGGNKYIWQETDGATGKLHQFSVDATGAWVDDGYLLNNHADFQAVFNGAYNVTDDKLYYSGLSGTLYSIPVNSATAPTLLGTQYATGTSDSFVSDGAGNVYFSIERFYPYGQGALYSVSANTVTSIGDGVVSRYGGLSYSGSTLYGLDFEGRIFQYSATIKMFTKQYAFEDAPINSIRTAILQAYNLVAVISSHKKAFVYRRGNDSGTIQTTGNALSLTTSNTSNIQKVLNDYQKILWVKVTSGETSYSYDGTTYNAGILSDSKTLEISNDLIPEDIVKDLSKYFFTFYNTAHDKYVFNVDVPKMEYEVMDGASVVFSTTKIAQTASGLITAQSINNDGTFSIEVIF